MRGTEKQWEKMFDSQGNTCAICGSLESGSKKGWHLDHCHKTKTIRFILCIHCNRGLGGFRDNPDLMRRAADTLEEFNKRKLEDEEGRD
jgi:Recombination endonuclease VII